LMYLLHVVSGEGGATEGGSDGTARQRCTSFSRLLAPVPALLNSDECLVAPIYVKSN
jgi:hypothetical protein